MSEKTANRSFASAGQRYANRGVTLLEMITVMGIVAILAAIAVPSYQYVTNANRIAGEANGLLGDLQFARAEAIKEGQPVSVCIYDGTNCVTGSSDWKQGWIVFSDVNGNGVADDGGAPLRVQSAFPGSDTFTANNNVNVITFNREGFATVPNGTMITLQTAPEVTAYTRCLSVGLIGLMAIQSYNGGTCL